MTLVHRDGVVVARYPVSEAALGERFAPLAALVASGVPLSANPIRATSPIDGIERFGAFQWVPGYPLGVLVTRDTRTALAPWRSQAIGTAARTLTLGALAAVLLAMLMRQHASLDASRRSAEASQARFVAAMTGSDSGIWGMDFVAGQGYGSPRMRQLLGLPPGPDTQPLDPRREEVERQVHPDDLERRRIAMEDHLAGRTDAYNVDYRVRRPDGRWHWIQVHGRCMRDTEGQPLQMAGSVIDIDARKRAEESLRASEERLALVISSSNEGILDWDVINDRMVVSQRALRILGLDESAPVDSQAQWASLAMPRFQPEDALRLAERLRGDAGTLADTHDGEYRVRDATGEHRWTRFRWVTVRDGGGRAVRWAGSLTDIDDRKRAEERRQRLEEKLRRAQKLESIGTLAGGIAHDFNNILAAVLGYGEMVQKDLREGSPQRKHIDAAMSAGMRGKSLVERILAFSRSGMGPRVPVHVQSVVEEALQAIAASLPARVQLVRRLDSGTSGVIGDPTQVHQVVMNLCTNAVHAMKDGGTLDVVLESTRLTEPFAAAAGTLPVGEYLRLEIADSGSGMTPEVLARIFDPFFTTKEVGVGTGLGLSLVHGIVTDLGGGIVVRSQAGSGSRFIVYLPRQTDVPRTEEAVTQEVERGDGQTVLLVDDELALVRLGEETLAEFGYEPIGFASSEAALQAFRADPDRFDVLVSDEAMPGLTGTELAREVRALRPGLPVLLMSGFITPAIADSAREAGVMQLLSKPLAARELTQALATALRRQSDGASN
jgi:PAS domain S-box-containing protein